MRFCTRFLAVVALWGGLLHAAKSWAGSGDTVRVFFPIGISVLDAPARKTLAAALAGGTLSKEGSFVIVGYADYLGTEASNKPLSKARAIAVRDFLVYLGLDEKKLSQVFAKGEVFRAGKSDAAGFAPDRRVDIVSTGKAAVPVATGVVDFSPQNRLPVAEAPAVVREQSFLAVEKKPVPPPVVPPTPPPAEAAAIEEIEKTGAGQTIVMRSMYFPRGSHKLLPQSIPQLIALQKALQENPKLKIRVEGHVCCIDTALAQDALDEGTGEYALSQNRARAIAQELVKRGIARERIQAVGYGKRRALFPREQNQEEAERNRRVEIRVLEK